MSKKIMARIIFWVVLLAVMIVIRFVVGAGQDVANGYIAGYLSALAVLMAMRFVEETERNNGKAD